MSLVYEYFVNTDGYITGFNTFSEQRRPDLIRNQKVLPEMRTTKRDSIGRLYNNGHVFKLLRNSITVEDYIDNGIVNFRSKWSHEKMLFAILKGMKNPTDMEYLELQTEFENL